MRSRILERYELFLVVAAASLLAASGGWMWWHRVEVRRIRLEPTITVPTGAVFKLSAITVRLPPSAVWLSPGLSGHDSGWPREMFAPLPILPDALSNAAVTPTPRGGSKGDPSFGYEVLAVQLEPFRLQLAGYFGEEGDYLAAFVRPGQAETLLARVGHRFEDLGLTFRDFAVRKVRVANPDLDPVYEAAAFATLLDEKTGTEIVLDSRTRRLGDAPQVEFRSKQADAHRRTLREGDTFVDAKSTYHIRHIQLDPPEVLVSRQSPDSPLPEFQVLSPVGRAGGPPTVRPPQAGNIALPVATGLVSTNN